MKRKLLHGALVTALALAVASSGPAFAQRDRASRTLPSSIAALKLDAPLAVAGLSVNVLDRSLLAAEGESKVIIRLSADSAASAYAKGADTAKAKQAAKAQQDSFLASVRALDPNARVVAQVQAVMNAVFVEVNASVLPKLAKDPRVVRIAPVANYRLDLSETVPYIGATPVQNQGFDGKGIKVAVLDSGIDYTHRNLGGPGTLAAYEAAWGTSPADPRNTTRDGLFPTAKVINGYDFVGEDWPNSPEAPDPDPIDLEGHGTHVADIIAGKGGVAPGAKLFAVKVCSAVSSSCSGIALIQGMDFAADPNGDGKLNDRVDIINMSLGSNYGQPFDDDLAFAVDNATAVGILTVASAGNGGDKPYIQGTPASAKTALSVAQTAVPSAVPALMQSDGASVDRRPLPGGVPAVVGSADVAD